MTPTEIQRTLERRARVVALEARITALYTMAEEADERGDHGLAYRYSERAGHLEESTS